MEQSKKRLTQTVGAIGIAAGLGLGAAGLASAVSTPSAPPTPGPSNSNESNAGEDHENPDVKGSIQVPEQEGAETDESEAAEAAALQAAATITPDQAKQAALAAVPGTAGEVELDNENGSVVYSVEITANGTTTDVTVDAGNGKVLAQETENDDNEKDEAETPDSSAPATGGITG